MARDPNRSARRPAAAAPAPVAPPVGSNPQSGGFLGYLKAYGPLLAAGLIPVAVGASVEFYKNRYGGGSYNGSMDYDW